MPARVVAIVLILVAAYGTASAQSRQQIAPFVIDLRGFTVGLGLDEVTAGDLGIEIDELPNRGFGGVAAANFYPIRGRTVSIGAAFEALIGRAKKTNVDPAGDLSSVVTRRLEGIAGGVSMNFGHREGFSYISVGMGPMMFESWTGDIPPDEPPRRPVTLNFGGGARWFTSRHLAFTFDVRFYETKPANTILTRPGRERRRLLVLSAGVSIR